MPFLQQCSQDELVQLLRSDGRRQAAQRMLKAKREGVSVGEDGVGVPASSLTAANFTGIGLLQPGEVAGA